VANALSGYITSLSVTLENASLTPVLTISATAIQRVVLVNLTTSLT
jgi:hypothetical protein